MTYTLLTDDFPGRRKILLSFYGLAFLYAFPYGALSSLVPGFFIYGAHRGASDESKNQAESIVNMQAPVMFLLWAAVQFFVPSLLKGLRGPRNAFVTMMFGWAVAAGMMLAAYITSLAGPSTLVKAFAIVSAILIGTFGPVGYTAADVYLDYSAEWMAHIDLNRLLSKPEATGTIAEGIEQQVLSTHTHHKALASSFKNRFAGHLYAIIEVGSLMFYLPLAIIGESAAQNLLIAVLVCLSGGAFASMGLFDLHEPPSLSEEDEDFEAGSPDTNGLTSKKCSCIRDSFALAWESFVSCFRCLGAYKGMAALAILPYFFGGALADVYRYNILLGPECGLDEETGIGMSKVSMVLLISTITQAISSFVSPMLIGEGRYQFREHVYPMAIGNGCGCISMVVTMISGNDSLCGSFGLMTTVNVLGAISFAVNSSIGVAAILSWYEGQYQHWVVAALASRSVWNNVGQAVAPFVYTQQFGELSNGLPCAALTFAAYGVGSICVIAAYLINKKRSKMGIDAEMTAGFAANVSLRSSIRQETTSSNDS